MSRAAAHGAGLALALHELATNAAKSTAHCALLGKLSLNWQCGGLSHPEWIETGGPRWAPPSARSFGLKVIRTSIENQLNGRAIFEWASPGMQLHFGDPSGNNAAIRQAAGSHGRRRRRAMPSHPPSGGGYCWSRTKRWWR